MSRCFSFHPSGCRLIIAETELGEKITRALILRRVALIEYGAGGPVLIGPALNPDLVRLQNFLARNGYPHQVLDPDEDADAKALVERYAPILRICRSPFCADGTVLKNRSTAELARCLGMVGHDHPDRTYDVAIVGAGHRTCDRSLCRLGRSLRDHVRCRCGPFVTHCR